MTMSLVLPYLGHFPVSLGFQTEIREDQLERKLLQFLQPCIFSSDEAPLLQGMRQIVMLPGTTPLLRLLKQSLPASIAGCLFHSIQLGESLTQMMEIPFLKKGLLSVPALKMLIPAILRREEEKSVRVAAALQLLGRVVILRPGDALEVAELLVTIKRLISVWNMNLRRQFDTYQCPKNQEPLLSLIGKEEITEQEVKHALRERLKEIFLGKFPLQNLQEFFHTVAILPEDPACPGVAYLRADLPGAVMDQLLSILQQHDLKEIQALHLLEIDLLPQNIQQLIQGLLNKEKNPTPEGLHSIFSLLYLTPCVREQDFEIIEGFFTSIINKALQSPPARKALWQLLENKGAFPDAPDFHLRLSVAVLQVGLEKKITHDALIPFLSKMTKPAFSKLEGGEREQMKQRMFCKSFLQLPSLTYNSLLIQGKISHLLELHRLVLFWAEAQEEIIKGCQLMPEDAWNARRAYSQVLKNLHQMMEQQSSSTT